MAPIFITIPNLNILQLLLHSNHTKHGSQPSDGEATSRGVSGPSQSSAGGLRSTTAQDFPEGPRCPEVRALPTDRCRGRSTSPVWLRDGPEV